MLAVHTFTIRKNVIQPSLLLFFQQQRDEKPTLPSLLGLFCPLSSEISSDHDDQQNLEQEAATR